MRLTIIITACVPRTWDAEHIQQHSMLDLWLATLDGCGVGIWMSINVSYDTPYGDRVWLLIVAIITMNDKRFYSIWIVSLFLAVALAWIEMLKKH